MTRPLPPRKDDDGTIVGSADGHRTMAPRAKRAGRRPKCLCGEPETHVGYGDGVALMGGCEWCVRRWVRDPFAPTVYEGGPT